MRIVVVLALVLVVLALIIWLGLNMRSSAFPPVDLPTRSRVETVPLPSGLPVPVSRFYEHLYGEEVPLITSAIVSGRARLRLFGVTFPARFRFTHDAGRGYRHYIEVTWFGFPIMRVNEWYLDGRARLELPFGVTEDEPKVDQSANLGLWAETVWLPAVLVTDPRVRWEPVDDATAALVVPFGEAEERLVMRFDETGGLLRFSTSMRYKDPDSQRKSLWINEVLQWGEVDKHIVPTEATVTWLEDGAPWMVLDVEEVRLNVDVGAYIRASGP